MVIMFRESGTVQGMAPQALSLYAAVNAVFYNRKTLVLQFDSKRPVEKLLRGMQDSEEELGHGRYGFDDTGIDSLMRRIETKRFEKEHFDIACRHMSKTENLLDVAGVSRKDDFSREILMKEESIERIIKEAKKIYDDIYILGDGKDAAQMAMLNKKVDLSMICIAQGRKEDVIEPESVRSDGNINEVLYMITDFDNRSAFDVATMKKAYGVKRIAVLPYNTGFKDAFNSQNILSFVMNNTKVLPSDANYGIISAVMDVEKVMMGQEIEEKPAIDLDRLNRVEGQEEPEEEDTAKVYTAENVRYTKKYTGHLWWKKEVDEYEVNPDHFDDEEFVEDEIEAGDKPYADPGYEDDEGYNEEPDDDWDDGEYVTEEPEHGNEDEDWDDGEYVTEEPEFDNKDGDDWDEEWPYDAEQEQDDPEDGLEGTEGLDALEEMLGTMNKSVKAKKPVAKKEKISTKAERPHKGLFRKAKGGQG